MCEFNEIYFISNQQSATAKNLKIAMSAITRIRLDFSVNIITIQSNLTTALSSINLSII